VILRQSVLGRDTERLIGFARVFLACAALLAPYFDSHASLQRGLCYAVAGYCAIGIAVLATQSGLKRPMLARAIHVLDLAFATIMLQSHAGAGFFLILATFCLLSSAMQWRWRIVILTGAYLLAAYLASVAMGLVNPERMTLRVASLILVPVGTSFVSSNAFAARERLMKLARWSSGRYSAAGDAVLRVFRHAADVLDADEVTVFYHEVDQPKAIKATYKRSTDSVEREPSDVWPDDTTAAELRLETFVLIDAERGLCLTHDGMKRVADATPGVELSRRSGVVISACFTGDFCSGRLFACGVTRWRWDQIVLAEIVASHVRSRLEGRLLRDRTARITAELERMRLSRDLHDGTLQSFTAARLQLNAISKEAPALERRISAVADLLQDEQQKLREFIENSRTTSSELVPVKRIAERIRVVAEHWRLQAKIEMECDEAEISDVLYREVYFIVGEALANSARHSRATSLAARLSCAPNRFTLVIEELDGVGDSDTPGQVVPRSIDERIRDLGGSLLISRGARGVSLKVELPTHG